MLERKLTVDWHKELRGEPYNFRDRTIITGNELP